MKRTGLFGVGAALTGILILGASTVTAGLASDEAVSETARVLTQHNGGTTTKTVTGAGVLTGVLVQPYSDGVIVRIKQGPSKTLVWSANVPAGSRVFDQWDAAITYASPLTIELTAGTTTAAVVVYGYKT